MGTPLVIVTLLAMAIRIVFFMIYQPVSYGDTPSYRRLAESVLNGFQRYDGTRTPGYPVFMALVGSDQRIFLAQLLLGLLITLLLFWIAWRLTGNGWLAMAVGLAHSLNLGQLFFEANLLTETLTTFWLVLALAGILQLLTNPRRTSIMLAGGIGLASALTAITRPLFIYLPFWLLLFVIWRTAQTPSTTSIPTTHLHKRSSTWLLAIFNRDVFFTTISMLIPTVLIIGSWLYFIHDRYHMWSLSTMTGYHMIQHSGNFFEYLPDEYANLRDTYLRYREAHIAKYGTQTNTIWEAIPEMQKVSGLTFYDLSRTLSRLSVWLILRHPVLFLENVIKGWWFFWRAPVYWQAEAFRYPTLVGIASSLVLLERGILVAGNLLFVAASLPSLFIKRIAPADVGRRAYLWCLAGTIWIGSVVQSLLDHGDNPRFLVPMQSLVVLWLLWFIYRIWSVLRMRV